MDYLGIKINIDESSLKPDFLNYLRNVEKDPESRLFSLISAIGKVEPRVLNYFIERCNSVWNGKREDFERKSSLDGLFHSAWEDEYRSSKRFYQNRGLFSGIGTA